MPCTVTVVNRVLLYTYAPRSAADAHAVVAEISAAFLGRDGVSMVSASMPNGRPHVFVVVDGPTLWAIEHGIPTIEINPGGTPLSDSVMFRFRLRAAEVLPALLDAGGYSLDSGRDARG